MWMYAEAGQPVPGRRRHSSRAYGHTHSKKGTNGTAHIDSAGLQHVPSGVLREGYIPEGVALVRARR